VASSTNIFQLIFVNLVHSLIMPIVYIINKERKNVRNVAIVYLKYCNKNYIQTFYGLVLNVNYCNYSYFY
jgi:hypothetical protein